MTNRKKPLNRIAAMNVSQKAKARFLHLQAQTCSDPAEVFETAIDMLYDCLPDDREVFVELDSLSREGMEVRVVK